MGQDHPKGMFWVMLPIQIDSPPFPLVGFPRDWV